MRTFFFLILGVLLAALPAAVMPTPVHAADTLCAAVKIQINQQVTFERQGFTATMTITNGLPTSALEDLAVSIYFTDVDGHPVASTTDPNATGSLFFYRTDDNSGIPSSVPAGQKAAPRWLIIPAPGASAGAADGKPYYVGATLSYKVAGQTQSVEVIPAYIYVQPQPLLTLDYFLPIQVYGDNPITAPIEPPVPFALGLRVNNTGTGAAKDLHIQSGQPKIIDNPQELAVKFLILGSSVNDQPASTSLLADLGTLPGGKAGIARWTMTSTLSGTFRFTANFTHADSLGGAVTSLLTATNSHPLVQDVLVDLAERDGIRDFLAKDGDVYKVYESEGIDTPVADISANVSMTGGGATRVLSVPPSPGFFYGKLADPFDGTKTVLAAMRGDGKRISLNNVWISKTFNVGANRWDSFINIFDVNNFNGIPYTLSFGDSPLPPVFYVLNDRVLPVNQPFSMQVGAYSPSGNIPVITASGALPAGAVLSPSVNGSATLTWTPTAAQTGNFPVSFTATDGALSTNKSVVLMVGTASLHDTWTSRYWPGVNDPLITGNTANPSGDGIPNLLKYALGLDPTKASPNTGVQLGVVTVDNKRYLTLTYTVRSDDATLVCKVVGADTPSKPEGQWTEQTEVIAADQTGVPDGMTRHTIRDSVSLDDGAPRRFLKLRVSVP